MSRGLDDNQVAASAKSNRIIFPLVEMYFDSGTLMLCLGSWDYVGLSGTYIHTGPLAYIRPAAESASSQQGIEVGLSGLDVAAMAIATSEPYRGRLLRLLKGYIDADTHLAVGQPALFAVYRMTNMTPTEMNNTASISVTAEHYEIELSRPAPTRWSDADQQRRFPGDLGCQYAAATSEKTVIWPSKQAQGG